MKLHRAKIDVHAAEINFNPVNNTRIEKNRRVNRKFDISDSLSQKWKFNLEEIVDNSYISIIFAIIY